MATKKTEDGIRTYLDGLSASTKPVIDREAIKSLKADIKAEADPIAKLRLLAALDEEQAGRTPDTEGDKAVFVAEAKAWAEAENIPVSAFQALKVPDDVLKAAGFIITEPSRVTAAPRANTSGTRAPRIPLEEVAAAAKKLGSGWKVADLADALQREKGTVVNYIKQLLDNGTIADLGEDPKHDGRGRAPKIYGNK